jgi:hypothetical protein
VAIRKAAAVRGQSLEHHRSRIVTGDDLRWADVVVYMDNGNKAHLIDLMQETNCRRHRWSAVSTTGIVVGSVELQGSAFVAYNSSGAPVGKFTSLTDARHALLLQHSSHR